jgi:ribosomal protein S18 acetylase RimI-like enzyme
LFLAREASSTVDIEILVSSILRAHGFAVTSEVLEIRVASVVEVDFHPRDMLLYAELDLERGLAYNHNVHINPRLRHRGVGARLLAALEEICAQTDLTILINNNRNPAFWKRHGYRRINPFWQVLLSKQLGITFAEHSMYKRL